MTLTPQQAEGIEKVKAWYAGTRYQDGDITLGFSADPFRWFGYAGTGKTFTAAQIPEALGLQRVVYGTYTGKAASVLRKSLARYGNTCPVTTIHSAIYYPTTSAEAREALRLAQVELAEHRKALDDWEALGSQGTLAGQDIASEVERERGRISWLETRIPELEAAARRLRFEFNPDSEWSLADLIILDEVSMVNAKLASDIESYGVPVLVLGDPAQLPPVEGGGYYTDAEPDHLLTDIQRQALDHPITGLATRVRQSEGNDLGLVRADMEPASLRKAMEADAVLCWSNERRWALINAIRGRYGYPEGAPVIGDKIMVLTNNKDAAVFNGEIFDVAGVPSTGELGPVLDVVNEDGRHRELPVFWDGFQGLKTQKAAKASGAGIKGSRVLATFAQAITVHKAQGSEWKSVYVVNQTAQMISATERRMGRAAALEQARQWLYTAATRAKEELTITLPR